MIIYAAEITNRAETAQKCNVHLTQSILQWDYMQISICTVEDTD